VKLYVLKDGLRYGTYSIEELQEQLREGVFNPENFASVDEGHSWTPIKEVSALAPPRYNIKTCRERNLLVITYRGYVRLKDVQQCAAEIRRTLPELARDFHVLVDFTEVKEMELSCASTVAEIMDLLNAAGVDLVVRVVPDGKADIGLQIMSLFHYSNDVGIQTCPNVEEAWTILDPNEKEEQGAIVAMS
jgi:anti-anti-sigma regulatory factor